MNSVLEKKLNAGLAQMKSSGTYKTLRYLQSSMAPEVAMEGRGNVIVMSSNNYLGFADNPDIIRAGKEALDKYGVGTASVRFICGTYDIHRELEESIASFFRTESALTYVSCWNANTGVIPAIAGKGDCLICDELNHASLIDGVRLSKAERKIYRHSDMAELEACLKESEGCGLRLIVTDGVFSMEGDIANLPEIVCLAEKYNAAILVDDSHGTGVLGDDGRGIVGHYGLDGKIDIITSTIGKALGGAAGGFAAGSAALIDLLSQISRPQIFSNALPPCVAACALKAIQILSSDSSIMERLRSNTAYLRKRLNDEGVEPLDGESAIVPVIIGETARAIDISNAMLEQGVMVTGFGYPVVPEGKARIRLQVSAALTKDQIDRVVNVFKSAMDKTG